MLGRGISYSSSPAMQNAAFKAAGLDWTYELLDVAPEGLKAAVAGLRAPEVRGANITIPYKQDVMDQLDVIDPGAVKVRAVNTIVNDGGRLRGLNTDIAAIRAAVAQTAAEPRGAKAVILGTGGAARAASEALEGAHVTFVSRDPGKVDVAGKVIGWDMPALAAATRAAGILVNATPLGRHGEMPIRPAALPEDGVVIDLVYVTGGTPLLRKARSLGLKTADGWEVLLRQGAAAFELWTGRPAPVEAMRHTLVP